MSSSDEVRAAIRRCVVRLAALCLLPGAAAAAPGAPPMNEMHHTSWGAAEGAPSTVITMAQTTDGWLWLGGATGLYRFDGVQFDRMAAPGPVLPSSSVSILTALPSGPLWIGYRSGGASLLRQDGLRNYDERDGLPANGAVWGIEQDRDGRVWMATSVGLYFLDQQRWRPAASDWGLPPASYKTLLLDRRGALWAQGERGVYVLPPGARRFRKVALELGTGVVLEHPDGRIWCWDTRTDRLRLLSAPNRSRAAPPLRVGPGQASSLVFDRDGALWIGRQRGLERIGPGGTRHTGRPQGLSGNHVRALLQDREGNVWASTANGIDRFRAKRVAPVALPYDDATNTINTLLAGEDGGVWVDRFHLPGPGGGPAGPALWARSPKTIHKMLTSVYRDRQHRLWAGGFFGLCRREGARMRPVALPPGVSAGQVNSMADVGDGALWLALAGQGLYRLQHGRWQKHGGRAGLAGIEPRVMLGDEHGRLWLGYARNTVRLLDGGGVRTFGSAEGLKLGSVLALHRGGAQLWAGGENGVAGLAAGRWRALTGVGGETFAGTTGIVALPGGDLWLNAGSALFRIEGADLAKALLDPAFRVRFERFNALDGLEGSAAGPLPTPSLIAAADGRLWLSTSAGVFWIDPARIQRNRLAPPTLIRALHTDAGSHPASPGMRLPARTERLRVDYTALSLGMPERVQFRYRLDGVDRQWQAAGARRAAYYTNMGPGSYRFHVMAANNDGVWNETGASLAFEIAPTLSQSGGFRLACALAAATLLWLFHRLRLRRLAARMQARLEERVNERERIARELHDTLLQSVQGLILSFAAVALRTASQEPTRALMEAALRRATAALVEGRDRVRDLRAAAGGDLGAAMAGAGKALAAEGGAQFRMTVSGLRRPLHPVVYEELFAIGREALINAFRHARARRIDVTIAYEPGQLRLVVGDDGIGIAAALLADGGRPGHWGLAGMRERSAKIHATLALRNRPGVGTRWTLTIPATFAMPAATARAERRWWPRPASSKSDGRRRPSAVAGGHRQPAGLPR